jgi:hypothetical protein
LHVQDQKSFWRRGDALTERDQLLLEPLRAFYKQNGFTPVKSDIPSALSIKKRFRTWGIAVAAADLPWVNYPEQQRLRAQQRSKQGSAAGLADAVDRKESANDNLTEPSTSSSAKGSSE